MVRLSVVYSDVDRATDDATHEANPRPRLRGDCEPLPCPHCGKAVAMRLGEDGGRLTITCPECFKRDPESGRVWGDEAGWFPLEDGALADVTARPVPAELLNHCRPCPWVGCVHSLYLDVMDNGASIRMNFPSKEPWELDETCALDVAERDGATLDEVGKTINITRERVRQLIEGAFKVARKTTNPMFKGSMDVEDVNDLPELRHPLTEAE